MSDLNKNIPVPKSMNKIMHPQPMPKQPVSQSINNSTSSSVGNSHLPVNVSAEYKTGTVASASVDSHSASASFDNSTTASANMTIGTSNASTNIGVNAKTGIVASASGGLDGNNIYANTSYSDTTEIHATIESQANYKGVGTSTKVDAYAKSGTEVEAHMLAGSKGLDVGGSVSSGSYIGVNASNTTSLREASVTTSAGVSVGEHLEAGGSGEATFKNGKATVGVSGDLAVLVGVNVDVSVTVDTHQIQKDAKVVATETLKIVNDPVVQKVGNDVANTANKAENTAKKAGNDVNKAFKKIHF